MKTHHPLSSQTLWLAAGTGLLVGLVCLLLDAGASFGQWLAGGFAKAGFPEGQVLASASPVSMLALLIFTVGTVFAVEGTPGVGRRVMLLLSGMVVLGMACPVLALWGVFWNPFVLLISVFWSGMVAMLHAGNREKWEALLLADERNVVEMNPPVSPSERRKRRK